MTNHSSHEWKHGVLKAIGQRGAMVLENYGSREEAETALKRYEKAARENGYILMKEGARVAVPLELVVGEISVKLLDHPI